MTCTELGFDDYDNLRLNKSSDCEVTLPFSSSFDFAGYTGELQIRATEGAASALLTVNTTPTASGSVITYDGSNIILLIKAADIATLPDNADDADEPWLGVYQWVSTDPDALTIESAAGGVIAEKGVVR